MEFAASEVDLIVFMRCVPYCVRSYLNSPRQVYRLHIDIFVLFLTKYSYMYAMYHKREYR